MVDAYLLRSLKRVHDECEKALRDENYEVNRSLVDRFNEVLSDFKREYPDDDRIQSIEEGTEYSVTGRYAVKNQGKALDEIQNLKLKTLQIADILGVDTGDFEKVAQRDEFAVINVNQAQAQEQAQTQVQRVSVDQIVEDVDRKMMTPDEKEELKDLIREYAEELEKEDTDASRLREIAAKARDYSDDVTRKLVMLATERGFDILVGLP